MDISGKKIFHHNIKPNLALKRKLWPEEDYRLQSEVLKNHPISGHTWQIKRETAVKLLHLITLQFRLVHLILDKNVNTQSLLQHITSKNTSNIFT
jgi:hypothetical protein